ncbi:L-ascorbate metabolism protein UlaG (beta-lactamase superfamily) [Arthrobacter stackebrandtii]|uniref:L-ascorbate metabolism protein UlaG (Beta-lactamase superfamily) n=1 Tax=Arthrobacter stackebrandtii TaxID=272161 RepID=A0ABS4YYJ0_9MICC|nr:MBL fold metallo-hydrolase [Arthrobacter stackebrandtii]MBP2413852.1 L-ascorbate metabolism protein UlaG (beta-lactamase superfamily) [Arthrobacter stackebrandtii]PYH00427.1 MBL fold metallo-hydrolase [Arthrobacter stackebrandtii]
MLLTKFTHACVRLEQDGRVLVIDPGVFSETAAALDGAQAVLITHEHPDHIDAPPVLAALAADPLLVLHAPAGVAASLRSAAPDQAGQVHDAAPGERFTAAGFAVQCFGGQHALIHPTVPMVANVGYLIDDDVYHPGDSLVVPDGVGVGTLLVPVHAPWSKVSEVVDFVVSVRAPRAFPIHDALLNENGLGFTEGHISRIGGAHGVVFRHLDPGQSVEL